MEDLDKPQQESPQPRRRGNGRKQALVKLIPTAILAVCGAILSRFDGNIRTASFDHHFIAWAGVVLFVVCSTVCLHIFTKMIRQILTRRLRKSRAANIQFLMRTVGYIIIAIVTLGLLKVPVGKLLLGGAVMGIVLGVAAQQALANFFATVVLIVDHPFVVGERVILNSGSLGGKYEGTITDMSLSHTRLEEDDGTIVLLPNATLLAGAAIISERKTTRNQPK